MARRKAQIDCPAVEFAYNVWALRERALRRATMPEHSRTTFGSAIRRYGQTLPFLDFIHHLHLTLTYQSQGIATQ